MSEAGVQARRGKLLLFASAAALALYGASAQAQTAQDAPVQTRAPDGRGPDGRGPDGLAPGAAYLESDAIEQNRDTGVWRARGRVESRYEGRVVRADEVD